jgi:hypothetical protein
MPDLSYSDDALNARSAFFGVRAVVYVEGDDDVLFWQRVFSRVTNEPFEVESVGGASTLDDYIEKILSGHLKDIAARDADFLPILGTCTPDPRIIYTFGYSIENSLYVSETVTELVRIWSKSMRFTATECTKWMNALATTVAPLIYLDVANAIAKVGVAALADNCSRYMTSDKSATLCPFKVAAAKANLETKIPSTAVVSATGSVGNEPDALLSNLRGHFLTSAIHRYLVNKAKAFGHKVSISAESLYAAAIMQFDLTLDANHPHKEYYLDSARAAWQAV